MTCGEPRYGETPIRNPVVKLFGVHTEALELEGRMCDGQLHVIMTMDDVIKLNLVLIRLGITLPIVATAPDLRMPVTNDPVTIYTCYASHFQLAREKTT